METCDIEGIGLRRRNFLTSREQGDGWEQRQLQHILYPGDVIPSFKVLGDLGGHET